MKKIISFDKEILFPTMIGEITAISLDQTLKFLSKNDIEGNFMISGRYKMTEASAIEEDFSYKLPIEITLAETFTLDTTKIEIKDFYYEIIDEEILKVKIDIQIEGVEEVILESELEEVVEKELEKLEKKEEAPKEEKEKKESLPDLEVVEERLEKKKEEERTCDQKEERTCDSKEKSREEKEEDVEPLLEEVKKEEPKIDQAIKNIEVAEKKEEEKVKAKDEGKEELKESINQEIVAEEVKDVIKQKEEKTQKIEVKEESKANIQSIFRVFNEAEETYKAYTVYIMRKNDSINTVLDRYNITKEQLEEYNDLSQIELGSKVIIPTTND